LSKMNCNTIMIMEMLPTNSFNKW